MARGKSTLSGNIGQIVHLALRRQKTFCKTGLHEIFARADNRLIKDRITDEVVASFSAVDNE